jgi:PASTA domain-containing protein
MRPHRLLKPTFPLVSVLVLSACLLIWASPAAAAGCENKFTNGDGNGSWNDGLNWEHSVPVESETVCIPAGIPEVTIGLAVPAKAKTIVAESPLKIESTATLTIKESSAAFANELTGVDLEGTIHTEGSSLKLSGANVLHGGGQITAAGTPTVTLVSGATLAGIGTIGPGFVAQSGSTVEPGGSEMVGTLTFDSAYSQSEGSHLDLDLASDSSFDQIHGPPSNDAFVFGTVTVHLLGGYVPTVGTSWEFLSGALGVLNGTLAITPSQFSIHSVPGGDELRLDSALPTGGGGGGGGGGGQSGGSGGTGSTNQGPGSSPIVPITTSPSPTRCVVPKVAGLPLAKAKKALKKAHCVPGKVKLRASATVKKGHVIGASKKAQTALPAGSKVNLTVSGAAKKA